MSASSSSSPPVTASSSPFSDRSTSTQPVNRPSAFHTLSPCLRSTNVAMANEPSSGLASDSRQEVPLRVPLGDPLGLHRLGAPCRDVDEPGVDQLQVAEESPDPLGAARDDR